MQKYTFINEKFNTELSAFKLKFRLSDSFSKKFSKNKPLYLLGFSKIQTNSAEIFLIQFVSGSLRYSAKNKKYIKKIFLAIFYGKFYSIISSIYPPPSMRLWL